MKGKKEISVQKGASIRGAGGHRLTGDRCTNWQVQVKKQVKSITAKAQPFEEKVGTAVYCAYKSNSCDSNLEFSLSILE